jgi:hypothetical protein
MMVESDLAPTGPSALKNAPWLSNEFGALKGIERHSIQRDYVREKSLDSLLMNIAERDG